MALRFRRSVLRLTENHRVTYAEGSIARATMCTGERCGRPSRIRPDSETQRRDSAFPPLWSPPLDSQSSQRPSGGCGAVIDRPIPSTAIYRAHLAQGDSQRRTRPVVAGGRSRAAADGVAHGGARRPGRSRHPHMALRFRGSVLRLAENYRVTCAGGTIARSAMPVVGSGPAAESGGKGFALGGRRRMVGPAIRPKPASPHGTPLPGKRATAGGKLPCHMRRWERSALGDANRREEAPRRRISAPDRPTIRVEDPGRAGWRTVGPPIRAALGNPT